MAYRNGNYAAFYVNEPFSESNLRAHATKDFVYYNELRMWKGQDAGFPFIDSHDKNYNVRDNSDWGKTLKPRLHDRLRKSKNIILFLSSITQSSSKALNEEIDYGIKIEQLPVIVVYPEYSKKSDIVDVNGKFRWYIMDLWKQLPIFKYRMDAVATLHIPMDKSLITKALKDEGFMVNTMNEARCYCY